MTYPGTAHDMEVRTFYTTCVSCVNIKLPRSNVFSTDNWGYEEKVEPPPQPTTDESYSFEETKDQPAAQFVMSVQRRPGVEDTLSDATKAKVAFTTAGIRVPFHQVPAVVQTWAPQGEKVSETLLACVNVC